MKSSQVSDSNRAIEFAKHFSRSRFCRNIVAGGEDMGGVEANTKPFRLARPLNNVGNLLEGVAQTGALTSRRLKGDPGFHFGQFSKHLVNGSDDCVESGFLTGAEMCAWM